MAFDLETNDVYTPWHVRRLRQHHRQARDALADAGAAYGLLREAPETSDLERHLALDRVRRAAQQLADIEITLDLLEDRQSGARARR